MLICFILSLIYFCYAKFVLCDPIDEVSFNTVFTFVILWGFKFLFF